VRPKDRQTDKWADKHLATRSYIRILHVGTSTHPQKRILPPPT